MNSAVKPIFKEKLLNMVLVSPVNSVQDPHKKRLPLENAQNVLLKWRLSSKIIKAR